MQSAAKSEVVRSNQQFAEEEVLAKLRAILADILVLNEEDIKASDKLVEDLDADSIAFLELTYRLRTDFGLEVPEAKVDEETLRMPLLKGLDRLEQTIGGTTLFESMKDGALLQSSADAETRGRIDQIILANLEDGSFLERLKAAVSCARTDSQMRRSVRDLVAGLDRTPELAAGLDGVLAQDAELAVAVAAIRSEPTADGAEGDHAGSNGLIAAWSEVAGAPEVGRWMTRVRVSQLAQLMGTDVPNGYAADAAATSLQLRDLFGFITVRSYAHYVMYLAAQQSGKK